MFVKQIFEEIEHFENRKKSNFNKICCLKPVLTDIMKADDFTCITPSHERSRFGFDGDKRNTMLDVEGYSQKLIGECKKRVRRTIA